MCEFTLGGHTASVNAVRWGGEGALYTASSDRTVKVWSADGVSIVLLGCFSSLNISGRNPINCFFIRRRAFHGMSREVASLLTNFVRCTSRASSSERYQNMRTGSTQWRSVQTSSCAQAPSTSRLTCRTVMMLVSKVEAFRAHAIRGVAHR